MNDDDASRWELMFEGLDPRVRAEVLRRRDRVADDTRDEAEMENILADDEDDNPGPYMLLGDALLAREVENELKRHRLLEPENRQTTTSPTAKSGERGSTPDPRQGILAAAREELRAAQARLEANKAAGTATAEDQRTVGRLSARVRILEGRTHG